MSEDEFEKLRDSCERFGARSISDFARSSVLARLEEGPEQAASPKTKIATLDNKVMELETRVSQLLKLVDATAPSTQASLIEMSQAVQTASAATTVP